MAKAAAAKSGEYEAAGQHKAALEQALVEAQGAREALFGLPWSHRHQFRFPHEVHCLAGLHGSFGGDGSGEIDALVATAAAEDVAADEQSDTAAAVQLAKIAEGSAQEDLPEDLQQRVYKLCAAAGLSLQQLDRIFEPAGLAWWTRESHLLLSTRCCTPPSWSSLQPCPQVRARAAQYTIACPSPRPSPSPSPAPAPSH